MSIRKSKRTNKMATGAARAVKQVRPPSKTVKTAGPEVGDEPIEADPAVERGERIQTGKAIARGGGGSAPVKGATADSGQAKKRRK